MCVWTGTHHDSRKFIFVKCVVLLLCSINTHIYNFKSIFIYDVAYGLFALLAYMH